MILHGISRGSPGRSQDAAAGASTTCAATSTPRGTMKGMDTLHRAGVRAAHLVAPGRGARPVARRSARRRSLRHRRPEDPHGRQRRPARAAEPADGPAADRGRRPRRHAQLQQVGLARRQNAEGRANNSIFKREAEDFPVFDQCVSALVEDLHQRGLDQDCTVIDHGRVRPHAEDQRPGRPRPLAAGQLRPAGRRRHEDRPGDRRHRPHRRRSRRPGRSPSASCTPRCTTTSASTWSRTTIPDLNGRPQYLVEDQAQPLRELV